eukprot:m.141087 g.141087  ORF g.141087 m.141087 type:complete len:405 (+) comp17104_c0_seq3:191-1405(+)
MEVALESLQANPVTTALTLVAGVLAILLFRDQWKWQRVRRGLSGVPKPAGSLPILGHALELAKAAPWDTMARWVRENDGKVIAMDFLMKVGIVVTDPKHIRRVFNSNQRNYAKDIELSYKPFMDLLGRGVVTSSGDDWRRKRKLIAPSFRVDILEETTGVAKRAVDRLSAKLEALRGTDETIDMAEEFRLLTLEVIGELILSLSPEESRRVFPQLYLPIVTEANKRIWAPWRAYLPSLSNYRYRQTVNKLNSYLADLVSRRWSERHNRLAKGLEPAHHDTLEHIMADVGGPEAWNSNVLLELRDAIKTFILAGHETSAAMMGWSLFQYTQQPNVQEKVLAEGRWVAWQRDQGPHVLPSKHTKKHLTICRTTPRPVLGKCFGRQSARLLMVSTSFKPVCCQPPRN